MKQGRYLNKDLTMEQEYVCQCMEVTKEDIIEAIKKGSNTLDLIQDSTQAGTRCGGCIDLIEEIINEEIK